jgi:hypothetical protein
MHARLMIALSAFVGSLLAFGGFQSLPNRSAWAAPDISSLRPMKGVSYEPAPSDDWQLQDPNNTQGGHPARNEVYYDTDFYNTDFAALWGTDNTGGGRNDLNTLQNAGINFLHIYNWNALRDHTSFLNTLNSKGMKVMVPVSNYVNCQIVGGCQGVGAGSYQNAYNNIQNIFNQVYRGTTTPHPAVAMWGIYNEYDLNGILPANVAFVVQTIIKLENDAGIPVANRLPMTMPVSFALLTAEVYRRENRQQPSYFRDAETLYNQTKPGVAVPEAVIAILALSTAFQAAQGTTSYGGVTVAAMPANFWTDRFIASVNPFKTPADTRNYITDANKFQSAFPGTTAWNTLPPMFFGELGIDIGGSGGTTQTQADWVLGQLRCSHPLAVSASATPQGYFFGSNIFMWPREELQGNWGMFVFTNPVAFSIHKTTSNQDYRVDNLVAQPVWSSVITGFQTTVLQCP